MASAQSVGVKAGLNYTTFQGDDAGQYDYRPGYTVGVTARKGINDLIGLQTELLYTSKGAKREFSTGSVNSEERLRLNYLDIPVLLSVQAGGLYFELGPQVSFLLKGKQILEVTNASGNTTTTTELDITDNPYPVDLGYAAGLGYRAGSGLGIGLRYNGGLKNIDDEGLFEGRERRNTSFQLTLSYTTGF
ncbi:MAG: PorT family protein [Hymenobacteraceae bacterium]|nr:PorT family protein [Hymenobacteraceae bacterium]